MLKCYLFQLAWQELTGSSLPQPSGHHLPAAAALAPFLAASLWKALTDTGEASLPQLFPAGVRQSRTPPGPSETHISD